MSMQYLLLLLPAALVALFLAGALIGLARMFIDTVRFLGRKLVAFVSRARVEEPAIDLESEDERPAEAAVA